MPKITRRRRAKELLRLAQDGPAFGGTFPIIFGEVASAEASRRYKLWAQSWLIPLIKQLVPELREKT